MNTWRERDVSLILWPFFDPCLPPVFLSLPPAPSRLFQESPGLVSGLPAAGGSEIENIPLPDLSCCLGLLSFLHGKGVKGRERRYFVEDHSFTWLTHHVLCSRITGPSNQCQLLKLPCYRHDNQMGFGAYLVTSSCNLIALLLTTLNFFVLHVKITALGNVWD